MVEIMSVEVVIVVVAVVVVVVVAAAVIVVVGGIGKLSRSSTSLVYQ